MNDQRIEIRPAGPGDRDQVWPLARALATSYTVQRPAFDRSFAALLAHPEAFVLVAERGGEIAGYLLATSHLAFHANGRIVWVEEVMVAAEARGAGTGRALMAGVEAWARDHEAAYVALATRRAAKFYRALGYEESATYFKKPLA